MATVCTNCGFNNPPGMRFCGSCGTRLLGKPAPARAGRAGNPAPVQQAETAVDPSQFGVMTGANLTERFRQAGLEAAVSGAV
jgi:hypothetical protein